jgi:hypothetical protein
VGSGRDEWTEHDERETRRGDWDQARRWRLGCERCFISRRDQWAARDARGLSFPHTTNADHFPEHLSPSDEWHLNSSLLSHHQSPSRSILAMEQLNVSPTSNTCCTCLLSTLLPSGFGPTPRTSSRTAIQPARVRRQGTPPLHVTRKFRASFCLPNWGLSSVSTSPRQSSHSSPRDKLHF